jgi:hypothetical protein
MKPATIVLLLASASCTLPLSPNLANLTNMEWAEGYWRQAQTELSMMVPPPKGDPFKVRISHFRFRVEADQFQCGPVVAVGCFYPGVRLIRYAVAYPQVLTHEAKHAILWKLKDNRWACIEHGDEPCP